MASEIRVNSLTNRSGLSTVSILDTGAVISGNITAVDGTFSGNVNVAGTFTYEDVTSVDSIGIITARSGIISPYADIDDFVSVGNNIHLGNAGIITATNVSVAQSVTATTYYGSGANLTGISVDTTKIETGNTKVETVDTGSDGHVKITTEGTERLRIDSSGRTLIGLNSSLLSYAGLQIKGDIDNGAHICLANKTATPSSGHNIGSLRFTNDAGGIGALIGVEGDGTWSGSSYPSRIIFATTASGATSGTERLRISSDGNLGIARANPQYRIHLHTAPTNSTQVVGLCIANDASNSGVGGKINLGAANGYDSTSAGISGWYDGTGTSLSLFTTASYASTGHVERLRITSDGKVRVPDNGKFVAGTDDDLQIHHTGGNSFIQDKGAGILAVTSNGAGIRFMNDAQSEFLAKFEVDGAVELYHDNTKRFETMSSGVKITNNLYIGGSTNGGFSYNPIADTLEFLTTNGGTHSELTHNAYVPSDSGVKHLGYANKRWNNVFCNGIRFGGENSDAHTLDDYEEGTYTPTYQNFSTTGTSTLVGKYVKVGRQVTVGIKWSCTGTIAHSTSAFVSLPFAMTYGEEYNGLIGMLHNNNGTSQTSGKSGVQCKLDGEGGSRFFPGSFTTTSSGETLLFGGTYIASA